MEEYLYLCQTHNQENVEQFKGIAEDFLYTKEAEYNLLIGLLEWQGDKNLITIFDDQKLVGCAIQTPPHNLVLTHMPEACLETLMETVTNLKLIFPGVVGPNRLSEKFSQIWSKKTNSNYRLGMDQKIYKLIKVIPPPTSAGIIRLPTEKDYSTLLTYFTDFVFEALPKEEHQPERAKSNLDRRIAGNNILVLEENNKIVSFVSSARPTRNGQCIAPVYTPKEFRGKGYASYLVAAMSQKILDSGKTFCCLYTDLSNPTSNSIYQKVGYKEVATSRHFVFY